MLGSINDNQHIWNVSEKMEQAPYSQDSSQRHPVERQEDPGRPAPSAWRLRTGTCIYGPTVWQRLWWGGRMREPLEYYNVPDISTGSICIHMRECRYAKAY